MKKVEDSGTATEAAICSQTKDSTTLFSGEEYVNRCTPTENGLKPRQSSAWKTGDDEQ